MGRHHARHLRFQNVGPGHRFTVDRPQPGQDRRGSRPRRAPAPRRALHRVMEPPVQRFPPDRKAETDPRRGAERERKPVAAAEDELPTPPQPILVRSFARTSPFCRASATARSRDAQPHRSSARRMPDRSSYRHARSRAEARRGDQISARIGATRVAVLAFPIAGLWIDNCYSGTVNRSPRGRVFYLVLSRHDRSLRQRKSIGFSPQISMIKSRAPPRRWLFEP
jgi:hypothetical protein